MAKPWLIAMLKPGLARVCSSSAALKSKPRLQHSLKFQYCFGTQLNIASQLNKDIKGDIARDLAVQQHLVWLDPVACRTSEHILHVPEFRIQVTYNQVLLSFHQWLQGFKFHPVWEHPYDSRQPLFNSCRIGVRGGVQHRHQRRQICCPRTGCFQHVQASVINIPDDHRRTVRVEPNRKWLIICRRTRGKTCRNQH
jgi:hypothetical protein